ncbi:shikimate dehydrogenase family protein [Hymenobacter coccineus]|uniref:Shikimate dehydrogenase n=1 Tax=Hymenobacter coccineus TaxID=1908235 RepID=A0A1G1TG82_9BACT|nr:shikimate dehydrogenase [Hymenobacter coccineus]OGX89869.1 shikimate dehydrogenase [Hymenobacter coccineus]
MREFGLIGRSLGHSFSQTYFTQKFLDLGLADCRYDLFELPTAAELPALLRAHQGLRGLNVTVPYKQDVLPLLDEVVPAAARIGAVNVIDVRPDGRLVGHNTDYIGFRESLRRFFPAGGPNTPALVLGMGGAAKAVEAALHDLGIPYQRVGRRPGAPGLTYADLTPAVLAAHPLIVNTTPVGTFPHVAEAPDLPYGALTPGHFLYDLVYNPRETAFMARGLAAGAQVKNGYEMLCLQAEAAWDIWNGVS